MADTDVEMPSGGTAAVTIGPRFNGPPESANGGYTCGLAAAALGADVAAVSLRLPPPLDVPLEVEGGWSSVELRRAGQTVVEADALERLDLEVPAAVSEREAERASVAYPWYTEHAFPTCFVCGPERAEGDGLRIFAGAVEGRDELFACSWTPPPDLADETGLLPSEIVWAALDCPSAVAAASLASEGAPAAVLARLTASLERAVGAGESHVVLAWPLGRDGRKREAGSAIVGHDGVVRARARALWIELEP